MMKETKTVPALLADDVPNAKKKVIILIAAEAVVAIAVLIFCFFAARLDWNIFVRLGAVLVWVVNDILAWQLWKCWAFRLTVTEKEVTLRLFCKKRTLPLSEIVSYETASSQGNYTAFVLHSANGTTLRVETQYPDRLTALLPSQHPEQSEQAE